MANRAASEIVIGPVITERTYQLYSQGRYTFKVLAVASKTEIKKALEEQYESQNITVKRINTEADVVWVDGHSDYGHAFEVFHQKWGSEVTPKTSVIILGDARNNYHASQSWVLAELRKRARHLYWIDPEPAAYWNTGDSVIGDYAQYCDGVYECRNLRQLERFVEAVIES